MYIDTLESVMSNSTKVMIDVEGGNNILYLPLDKILEQNQTDKMSTGRSTDNNSGANYGNNIEAGERRERR
jgi:membrane protease subunit HflK